MNDGVKMAMPTLNKRQENYDTDARFSIFNIPQRLIVIYFHLGLVASSC